MAKHDQTERPCWNRVSAGSSNLKCLWRQWDHLEVNDEVLYRKFAGADETIFQLIVPKSKQTEVIHFHHDIPSACHLGVKKTSARILQAFYWPGMSEAVQSYCKMCDNCTVKTLSRESNKVPLEKYMAGEPMERDMLDILGPWPTTRNNNKYILVISDWLKRGLKESHYQTWKQEL